MTFPRLSSKEGVILSLLLETPELTGTQLVEAAEGDLKMGTVYTTLGRMQVKQLVSSSPDPSDTKQRLYRATPQGRQIFRALVAAAARIKTP